MKDPKTKPAKLAKSSRPRNTQNKRIAAAPTLAEQAAIALWPDGKPPTEIQHLPFLAEAFQSASPALEKSLSDQAARFKGLLAKIFFPALIKNDIKPFKELIQAMKKRSRMESIHNRPPLVPAVQIKSRPPSKSEIGRRLREALLFLNPDDLLSIQTVKDALNREGAMFEDAHPLFSDDSQVYAVMDELKLRFLQPGDWAEWSWHGKVLRRLEILPNGKPKIKGMPLVNLLAMPNKNLQTYYPNPTSDISAPDLGRNKP